MALRSKDLVDRSQVADDEQREERRKELHAIVDLLIDSESVLAQQVRDFGSEFPSGSDGGGFFVPDEDDDEEDAGPVLGSITERRALSDLPDYVQQAKDTLRHRKETVSHLFTLRNEIQRCIPFPLIAEGGEAGCQSCARLKDERGRATFVAVDAKRPKTQRCRWCYDFNREYRTDPPVVLLEDRAAGLLITRKRINDALAKRRKPSARV